ncbi:MAG: hypothetical protein JWP48_4514 [Actinoallomurus sp.]|jgi:uncharacterized membrane protein|nr:hypothetical protein [Actinoallomurus sp.]
MTTSVDRSPERLVFFSDAVVAIALTLLILPLVDAVQEAASHHTDSFEVISGNQWKIYSFLLSFAVIARIWVSHHRLFEQVKAYNRPLMVANLWWLLTIVVLPFPTEMIGGFDEDRFTATFYIGTILAANLCVLAMILIVRADPALLRTDAGALDRQRFAIALNAGLLALGLALAALVPRVGYFALLLLLLVHPVARIRDRRTAGAPA